MDQKMIMELNQIPEKEQRSIVLSRAKVHGWYVYFAIIKKKQKDGKNFHILTDNGLLLQRMENKDYMNRSIVEWSMVKKDTNERITGDYGTVICEFVAEYGKTHQTICL
jgi:hypothetical protein